MKYAYPGFAYDARILVHDCTEDDPYNKETLIAHYNFHNEMVQDYFRNRPQDLLVLNVAETDAYEKLCAFLGKPSNGKTFPWKNKT
ncbi:MAG: sulfotransferase [Pseudomonadota bacterium]